jgi:hypothetical protein
MSAINGDKSRHSIDRKRGVHRREKIRQLLAARKQQSGAKPADAPAAGRKPR